MRLVTYSAREGETPVLGALSADRASIFDLNGAFSAATNQPSAALTSMLSLIDSAEHGLEQAHLAIEHATAEPNPDWTVAADSVQWLAPLPNPRSLRCCSLSLGHYRGARRVVRRWAGLADDAEIPALLSRRPMYYKGNALNLIGTHHKIDPPAYAARLDFELELALITGKRGRDISVQRAAAHIFGYSIFNDVSARDPQLEEMQLGAGPTKGKDFDTANILGPCIVTTDEFRAEDALATAHLNGKLIAQAEPDFAFTWPQIIAYMSESETLHPGEIIASGAYAGCSGIEHEIFLTAGDRVECEIRGIGTLTNSVAG
jgi:2-keto-4-pentenoate hydratase/2-oxohepta-3-ene-1,7-dioic acid hydratase in catechol pathway